MDLLAAEGLRLDLDGLFLLGQWWRPTEVAPEDLRSGDDRTGPAGH